MKITKSQLRQIIKEEVERALAESDPRHDRMEIKRLRGIAGKLNNLTHRESTCFGDNEHSDAVDYIDFQVRGGKIVIVRDRDEKINGESIKNYFNKCGADVTVSEDGLTVSVKGDPPEAKFIETPPTEDWGHYQ